MNVMIDDWVQFNVEGKLTQKRVTGIQDNGKYIQTEETDTYYNKNTYKPIHFTPDFIDSMGEDLANVLFKVIEWLLTNKLI